MKAMYTAYTHGGNLYIVQVPPMYGLTGLMNDRKHSSTHSEILAVLYPRSITHSFPVSFSNELWILSKIITQFTLKCTYPSPGTSYGNGN
jgi:hypothetical protein